MIALLLQMGIKAAKEMSLEDASKQERKMRRAVEADGMPMHPAQLAARSLHLRRARRTHPGKR